MEKTISELLIEIQKELKCPKDKWNNFGKYKYRSAESILENVKPLLHQRGLYIISSSEPIAVGDRNYIKTTVTISNGSTRRVTEAIACEQERKKGMDSAQITGAAISYSLKYALGLLFGIDDGQDPDSQNKQPAKKTSGKATIKQQNLIHRLAGQIWGDGEKMEIENRLEKKFGVKTVKELNKNQASSVITLLKEHNETKV